MSSENHRKKLIYIIKNHRYEMNTDRTSMKEEVVLETAPVLKQITDIYS